jgi:hypothetical protein
VCNPVRCDNPVTDQSKQPPESFVFHQSSASPCTVLKYKGLCGTILCYIMNAKTSQLVKVRALLDSGANGCLVDEKTAQQAGLTGPRTKLVMNVAGNQTLSLDQKEVSFQLVSLDKSFVSPEMLGSTIPKIGAAFKPVNVDPKRHDHLADLDFTEQYPCSSPRAFQVLVSEPYYSQLSLPFERKSSDAAVPSAKLTELGWVLRGAEPMVWKKVLT